MNTYMIQTRATRRYMCPPVCWDNQTRVWYAAHEYIENVCTRCGKDEPETFPDPLDPAESHAAPLPTDDRDDDRQSAR